MGGDARNWSEKCKNYEQKLVEKRFKDRYSGSFVGDFNAILHYGGVYSYFCSPQPKLRLYYEWLPIAFMAKTLGGEFLIIDEYDKVKKMEDIQPLTKQNVNKIHSTTSGGLLGNKIAVDYFF